MHLIALFVLASLATPLYEMDEAAVDEYVRSHSASAFEMRLIAAAQDALGTAYHDGPLGEGEGAAYDADPLIDLTRVDCVTYVEQSIALAAGGSYDDSFAMLQRVRYAGGAVDYETRNHFLISDWTEQNTFCDDITTYLCVPTTPITRTISKRGFFERVNAAGLGTSDADREVTVHVIASSDANAAEEHLPDVALIVFVGKVDWLFALHCGLYIRDASGEGKLYHASSKAGEVVAADLQGYLDEQADRYLGFSAYKLRAPFVDSDGN